MIDFALAILLLGNPLSSPDTVFSLREGDKIVIADFRGSVDIRAWDRSEMEVGADSDEDIHFELHRSGNRVELRALDRKNRNRADDLRLRIPGWAALEVSGRHLDALVTGVQGSVKIRTLGGDIRLEELSGEVDAGSSNGEITARDLSGTARFSSGGGEVTLVDSRGEVRIETVSGDVVLMGAAPRALSIRTTSGDVDFQGTLGPGGPYAFNTHSGDLDLALSEPVDLDARVLAYDGDFESDFPIRARGFHSGKELSFTIGSGGSSLLLEAFGGEIRLRRGRTP